MDIAGAYAGVRELMCQIEPLVVTSGSTQNLDGMIQYLEETDEDFPHYLLVRSLKQYIKSNIGSVVNEMVDDELVDQTLMPSELDSVSESLAQKVQASPSYETAETSLKSLATQMSEKIVENFSEVLEDISRSDAETGYVSDYVNVLDEALLSQTTVMFLSDQQFVEIARNMAAGRPKSCRADAINTLLQSHCAEVTSNNSWPDIRKALQDCLLDEDESLAEIALNIHSKLLKCDDHLAMREACLSLLETTTMEVLSGKLVSLASGVKLTNPAHRRMLNSLKLLIEFMRNLPNNWTRIADRYVEEIIENTLDLMSLSTEKDERGSYVLPLMALLDPHADWFFNWMQCRRGQDMIVRKLCSSRHFVRYLVTQCTLNPRGKGRKLRLKKAYQRKKEEPLVIHSSCIKLCCYLHNVHIITALMASNQGRSRLFPITISSSESIYPQNWVVQLIESLSFLTSDLRAAASKLLTDLCDKVTVCRDVMAKEAVIDALLDALKPYAEGTDMKSKDELLPCILPVVSAFVQSPPGMRFLISSQHKRVIRHSYTLIRAAVQMLRARHELGPFLVGICAHIGGRLEGYLLCKVEGFFMELAQTYREIRRNRSKNRNSEEDKLDELLGSAIVEAFGRAASTPQGMFFLHEEGLLGPVLESELTNQDDDEDWLKMLHLMSATPRGVAHILRGSTFIQTQMLSLELAVEACRIPLPLISRYQGQEPLAILQNLLLTMATVTSVESLIGSQYSPSLRVLEQYLKHEQDQKGGDDDMRAVVWRFAVGLFTNLNIYVLLETSWNVKAEIGDIIEERDGVIDEVSLLGKHLLGRVESIGGYGERTLPSLHLQEPQTPVNTHRRIPRKLNDLNRFLADSRKGLHDNNWLGQCKRVLKTALSIPNEDIKMTVLVETIEGALTALINGDTSLLPALELFTEELSDRDRLGCKLALNYGTQMKVIMNSKQTEQNLRHIITSVAAATHAPCFDWFAASIFLMLSGNVEKCKSLLCDISCIPLSAYLWSARSYTLPDVLPGQLLIGTMGHWIEFILEQEVHPVYQALKWSGVSAAVISGGWLEQLWWNILPWKEITNLVTVVIVFGMDYMVYFTASVFLHLQDSILEHAHDSTLNTYLQELWGINFNTGCYMQDMETWSRKYRRTILSDLAAPLQPHAQS